MSEEVLSRTHGVSEATDEAYIPESGYTDPTTSHVRARALYDYNAFRDDELNLTKNCIITNIIKKDVQWWKGDYGGRKQHWFPANFVQEIESSEPNSVETNDLMPLGDLQKGSIDILGNEK